MIPVGGVERLRQLLKLAYSFDWDKIRPYFQATRN